MKAYQAGNPTKVDNLKDIRYLSGGKNNQAVIDKQGEVYICGQNSYGELGKGTKTNVKKIKKLSTIDEVIDIDEGNILIDNKTEENVNWLRFNIVIKKASVD